MRGWTTAIIGLFVLTAGTVGVVSWPWEHARASEVPRGTVAERAAVGARLDLAAALARAARTLPPPPPPAAVRWACLRATGRDGRPVGLARATGSDPSGGETTSTVGGEDGSVAVAIAAPSTATVASVRVVAPDGREARVDWVELHDGCSGVEPLDVEVHDVATVRGVVVDEAGEPVMDATLVLRSIETEPEESIGDALLPQPPGADAGWDGILACDVDERDALTHTAGDGTFVLPLHDPGAFTVAAQAAGTTQGFAGPVQVLEGGDARVRIVVHPAGAAVGTVVDDAGAPVPGAWLTVAHGDSVVGTQTTADGTFRVDGLPKGAWTVSATAPEHLATGEVPLALDRPDTRLVVARGASLVVHACIDGAAGSANVSLGTQAPHFAALTFGPDGCGTVTLRALTPGTTPLWLSGVGFLLGRRAVTIGAAETRVEVRASLAGGAHVTARYPRGVEGTPPSVLLTYGAESVYGAGSPDGGITLLGDLDGVRVTADGYDQRVSRAYHAEAAVARAGDTVLELLPRSPVDEDDLDDDYEPTCAPPVELQWTGGRVTYGTAAVTPALEAGDQVVSVDGRALGEDLSESDWYGRCDGRVMLRVYRPATAAFLTVRATRSEQPDDD